MASFSLREVIISTNNEGPVVNIAAWLGTIIMVLAVFVRIGCKFSVIKHWTGDDSVIILAMVCSRIYHIVNYQSNMESLLQLQIRF